ncbi:MAG: hypothetical protein ABUL60_03690 [Myxococcales bacterium]
MADHQRSSTNPRTFRTRAVALGIAACGASVALSAANTPERYRHGANLETAFGWCWAAVLIYFAWLAWRRDPLVRRSKRTTVGKDVPQLVR